MVEERRDERRVEVGDVEARRGLARDLRGESELAARWLISRSVK
jgi:hypothetical protein